MCGVCTRHRLRSIVQQRGECGMPCPVLIRVEDCGKAACPSDCILGPWGTFSQCTETCGGGTMTRHRVVQRHPKHGGISCTALSQTKPCQNSPCPCGLGMYPAPFFCKKCPEGKYAAGAVLGFEFGKTLLDTQSRGCDPCPAGHYQAQLGQASCSQCPAGRYNTFGKPDLQLPKQKIVVLTTGSGAGYRRRLKAGDNSNAKADVTGATDISECFWCPSG